MTKICDQRVLVGMKSSHPWFSSNHLDEGTLVRPIRVLIITVKAILVQIIPSRSTESTALARPSLEESEVCISSIR